MELLRCFDSETQDVRYFSNSHRWFIRYPRTSLKNLSKSYFLVNELKIFENMKKYMALYGKFQKINKAFSFIYEKSLFLDVPIFSKTNTTSFIRYQIDISFKKCILLSSLNVSVKKIGSFVYFVQKNGCHFFLFRRLTIG